MQPPFNLTGVPLVDWGIFIAGALFCLYWLRALRLAREGVRYFLRNLAIAVGMFFLIVGLLAVVREQSHLTAPEEQLIAGFGALLFLAQRPRRSRYTPRSVRRAVIARDLKGEKFDPARHHIDHVWPYARGGSQTEDNLRVIEKRRNLQKGSRRPRLRDMW